MMATNMDRASCGSNTTMDRCTIISRAVDAILIVGVLVCGGLFLIRENTGGTAESVFDTETIDDDEAIRFRPLYRDCDDGSGTVRVAVDLIYSSDFPLQRVTPFNNGESIADRILDYLFDAEVNTCTGILTCMQWTVSIPQLDLSRSRNESVPDKTTTACRGSIAPQVIPPHTVSTTIAKIYAVNTNSVDHQDCLDTTAFCAIQRAMEDHFALDKQTTPYLVTILNNALNVI